MTLTGIASERGVDVTSLKRKLRRAGVEPPKTNDETLEQSVVDLLTTDKRKAKQNGGIVATLKKDFETPIKMPEIQANPKAHHQNGAQDGHSHVGKEKVREIASNRLKSKTLQQSLSADWLTMTVLVTILLVDVMVFSIIGQHEFGNKIGAAWAFFGLIGFATGIGSISTYNRIKDTRTAETWKYIFSLMQLVVFMLTMNEMWGLAETVMSLMLVSVFTGVQRAIKN